MAEKTKRPRTQCKRCKQGLSYSTYFRHRSMPYCPGYTEPIPQKTDNNIKEIDLEDPVSLADSPNTSLESSSQSS